MIDGRPVDDLEAGMGRKRLMLGAVALAAALAWAPGAGANIEAASSPHTAVSSNGSATMAPEAASIASASSAGSGVRELRTSNGSASAVGPVRGMYQGAQESVIGADGRTRVNPTTTYPARATAWILFNNGSSCTGWFISPSTVATAGHCVHSGGSAGAWYPTASYKVYPGRNGTTSPYGYCTAASLHSVTGWTTSRSNNYDYGAIKLNCTAGNTVGWYGFYWTSASLLNTPATIQGYPGDKASGTQWKMSGPITVNGTYRVSYTIDTFGGQSGSAVWTYRNNTCTGTGTTGVCSMGIHTLGGTTSNSATRITQTVFNNLIAWK